MFIVHLLPQFQEDEGRLQYCGSFATEDLARAFIEKQVKASNGYYRSSCYSISQTLRY